MQIEKLVTVQSADDKKRAHAPTPKYAAGKLTQKAWTLLKTTHIPAY
jgi:hypothetical protein